MSKLADVLTLAKAGYKANEIAEMLKEVDTTPEHLPKDPEPQPEPQTEPQPEPQPEPSEKDVEIEALKAQLKAAQQDNIRKNMQGTQPSDDDILADAIRRFM
ncbi:MAG: hypothetical protein KBT06_01220 [Prevotellaceae bacterium]|nr:hypothetical protein [Candidatus Colivivens equi]